MIRKSFYGIAAALMSLGAFSATAAVLHGGAGAVAGQTIVA
jgi:hypothetical protein